MTPRREPQQHELKCWPEYYQPTIGRIKLLELRKNDRDYQAGDTLFLREWDNAKYNRLVLARGDLDLPALAEQCYTGRVCVVLVSHIVTCGPWLADGFCAMSVMLLWETVQHTEGW